MQNGGLQGEISVLTGGHLNVGQPFCDDYYNEIYGDVEEMRMYCGSGSRPYVEGIATRYGPRPGENMFAWTQVHGGRQMDSLDY